MSDQEKKNIEQVVQEAETAATASAESAATVEEPEPHVVASPTPVQPHEKPDSSSRKGSSFIAWLALLLVLVLAGGAAWSVLEMQRREAVLVERVAELEGIARQKDSNLEQVADKWQAQLKTGLGKLQDELGGEAARQAQALQGVETLLAEQRAELARFSAADRESWLLAEAEYLLRLANQRLIMAGDTVAAQALLSSADDILRELDDVGLHDVRGAVTADLAAVRAVPRIDVEGIYLRLGALVEQADNLVIFQMPEIVQWLNFSLTF